MNLNEPFQGCQQNKTTLIHKTEELKEKIRLMLVKKKESGNGEQNGDLRTT